MSISVRAPRQTIDGPPKPKKFAADPVDLMLTEEARQDHAKAPIRGERALFITDRVIARLQADGVTLDPAVLRPVFLQAVIEVLYPGVAVDVPRYR